MTATRRKIAIIGSGISGLTAGFILSQRHEVHLFECEPRLGGHTHTVLVPEKQTPVDTGFIVFNDWTYPNFIKLMNKIGVESQESEMSFSVFDEKKDFEYNGHNLNTLFSQRSHLFSPQFYRFAFEIMRFNKMALQDLDNLKGHETLGQYLAEKGFSRKLSEYYLLPMASAIWSAGIKTVAEFPLKTFITFCKNHGLLSVTDRPTWRVLRGGSKSYIHHLVKPLEGRIFLGNPVVGIKRNPTSVTLKSQSGLNLDFDDVILACHSDQAIKILTDASKDELAVLSALPYQENKVTLHTDPSVMPKRPLSWASWNYKIQENQSADVQVTYYMNRLQRLQTEKNYFVTLNSNQEIQKDAIIKDLIYHHPVYTKESDQARAQKKLIQGKNRTYFAGAYWRYGFHEDGCLSGVQVAEEFDLSLESS